MSNNISTTSIPPGRILSLDALRGLAASVVVLGHFRMCLRMDEPRWFMRPLFAGRASVVLFFVLSGYVLSIPIWRGVQQAYGRYLVRRLFRMYIPFAAAALLAFAVGRHMVSSNIGLTSWFNETWQMPMTLRFMLNQLLTIPTTGRLNTAFWSLRYEVEMALVFPMLCSVLARLPWLQALATICIAWKASLTLLSHHASDSLAEPLITISWGACFLLGALLSRQAPIIGVSYRKSTVAIRVGLFVLSVLCFYSRQVVWVPFGACGILMIAEHEDLARRWLSTAIPEYLGRISYSMYLVHGTVLWAVMILLVHRISISAMVVTYLSVTLIVSHLFCVAVEEPAMRTGRRLTTSRGPKLLGQSMNRQDHIQSETELQRGLQSLR